MPPKKASAKTSSKSRNDSKGNEVAVAGRELMECLITHCKNCGKLMQHTVELSNLNAEIKKGNGKGSEKVTAESMLESVKKVLNELKGQPTCALRKCAEKLIKASEVTIEHLEKQILALDTVDNKGTKEQVLQKLRTKLKM